MSFFEELLSSPAFWSILIGFFSTVIGILFTRFIAWLNIKIGKEKFEELKSYTRSAVEFVEQIALKYGWDKEAKFQAATIQVKEWATSKKIKLSEEQIRVLIEQAVYNLKGIFDTCIKADETAPIVPIEEEIITPVP